MMYPFPFFRFPFFRRPYNNYYPYNNLHNQNINYKNNSQTTYSPSNFQENNYTKNQDNINFYNMNRKSNQNTISHLPNNDFINNINGENTEDSFDFFGLKLNSDDLLILALLFFLYKEDVKDTYLYIALILLLLS